MSQKLSFLSDSPATHGLGRGVEGCDGKKKEKEKNSRSNATQKSVFVVFYIWTQKRKYTRGKKKNQILLLFFRLIQKRKKKRHKGLSSVVQRPVHILGKYFNPAEKSMPLCVRPGADTSQQMSESPLSSLNKQLNWADLLIIYRIGSQGATAFVGDTDSICP